MNKDLIDKAHILAVTGEDYFESDIEAVNAGVELLKNPIEYVRFALAIIDGVVYNLEESQKVIITVALNVIKGKYPTKNLIINCPPALGKTSLVVWGLMSYLYSVNSKVKNLHISRFDELVKDNSNKIRSILTSEAHYRIFGVELSKNTTSKGLWETIDGGAFKASSAGGAITGFRAGRVQEDKSDITGVMVLDDAQKPTDIYSIPILESINQRWDNTYRSRRASIKYTPTILIMQRLGENDLTNHLLNNTDEEWLHLVIPSYVTGDEIYEQSGIYIPHGLKKGSTFKRRWTDKEAFNLLKDVQYSQQVFHTDGEVFQKDWFKTVNILPNIKEWHIKADTATKTNRYSDYTTFSLFAKGIDNKAYHIMLLREKIAVPHLYTRFISFVKESLKVMAKIGNNMFSIKLSDKEFNAKDPKLRDKNFTCILKVAIEDRDSGQGLIQTIKDKAYLDNDLKDILFVGVKRSEGKYSRALRASDKIKDGSYLIWEKLIFKTSADEYNKLNASNVSYIGVIKNEFIRFKADDSHKNDDIIDNVFDMMNYEIPKSSNLGFLASM